MIICLKQIVDVCSNKGRNVTSNRKQPDPSMFQCDPSTTSYAQMKATTVHPGCLCKLVVGHIAILNNQECTVSTNKVMFYKSMYCLCHDIILAPKMGF